MAKKSTDVETNKENIVIWQRRIWLILGLLGLTYVLLFLVNLFRPVITPFIYALAIVYILKPMVDFFDKRGLPRLISLIIAYLIFILIAALFFIYVIPIIVDQFRGLINSFPGYIGSVQKNLANYLEELGKLKLPFDLKKLANELLGRLQEPGMALFSRIPGFTANLFSSFFNMLIAPILAFYILKDYEQIRENIKKFIPVKYRDEVTTSISTIDEVISNYLKGQFLVAFIVGILIIIGLSLLGIDYALIIGILGGIFNIIPYLGPIIGAIPAILIAFFKQPILALWVIILMVAIQQIDSFLISPNIMKKQMDLHPSLIVLALMIGGLFWGILGMLLAIPLTAAGKAIIMYYLDKSPYYQEEKTIDES